MATPLKTTSTPGMISSQDGVLVMARSSHLRVSQRAITLALSPRLPLYGRKLFGGQLCRASPPSLLANTRCHETLETKISSPRNHSDTLAPHFNKARYQQCVGISWH